MNPAINGSSALQRFEHGNMVKIRNRIMFDFYLGLPHTVNLEVKSSSHMVDTKSIIMASQART